MSMETPYTGLPDSALWRKAVAEKNALHISDFWKRKFLISRNHKIVTAGSCFAQHIGRALVKRRFRWLDAEPAPNFMNEEIKREFNYGLFTFRTGNIYTPALLRQWLQWAFRLKPQSDEIWEKNGRFFDPFRPTIEPNGFLSEDELRRSRDTTLSAIRRAFTECRLFIFTMGLTESWENVDGNVYPLCPGTAAGKFDADSHTFRNYSYKRISEDMKESIDIIRKFNPGIRVLLTVSPVPLVATASEKHILVATTYSKSVLRAVAGDLAESRKYVDYFPSYELISTFPFRGMFFEPNMRSVAPEGVDFVMRKFFDGIGFDVETQLCPPVEEKDTLNSDIVVCEEAILDSLR